jgi:hypothetical protein
MSASDERWPAMEAAVMLRVLELERMMPEDRRAALALLDSRRHEISTMIGEHGDHLLYGGKYHKPAWAAAVDAFTIMAFTPGGMKTVRPFGMTFEATP